MQILLEVIWENSPPPENRIVPHHCVTGTQNDPPPTNVRHPPGFWFPRGGLTWGHDNFGFFFGTQLAKDLWCSAQKVDVFGGFLTRLFFLVRVPIRYLAKCSIEFPPPLK